jgi:hypothetical protein
MSMADQIHIRNAEAAQLARLMARQSGKTISEVVLDALRRYRSGGADPPPPERIATWRRRLRSDRQLGVTQPETSVEALYDEATGLPQ